MGHLVNHFRRFFPRFAVLGTLLIGLVFHTTNIQAADHPRPPLVEVTGKGRITAMPNEAELSISFLETNLQLETARQIIDEQVMQLLSVLDRFDLDTSSLDTSQITIHPRYDYRQNNNRTFIGYQVNRSVSFTLVNLSQLDTLVKALSEENISRLDHIRFTHSNPEKLQEEALDKAMQNSKELANRIAEAYGAKLGKVYNVTYHDSVGSAPPPPLMRAMTAEMASSNSPANYQQKELEFEARVNASFLLK